jgi:hypothetical protein
VPDPIVEPSACGHCGVPKREHFRRWTTEAKWHPHVEPTQQQIKERMQARRTVRQQIAVKRIEDSFDAVWGPGGSFTMDGPDWLVVIDHTVYKIGPEHGRSGSGFRGFCGRRFDIDLLDGRTVATTNLWEAKTVPPKWRERWPDTARFATRTTTPA